jgi:hypothetical protein
LALFGSATVLAAFYKKLGDFFLSASHTNVDILEVFGLAIVLATFS